MKMILRVSVILFLCCFGILGVIQGMQNRSPITQIIQPKTFAELVKLTSKEAPQGETALTLALKANHAAITATLLDPRCAVGGQSLYSEIDLCNNYIASDGQSPLALAMHYSADSLKIILDYLLQKN